MPPIHTEPRLGTRPGFFFCEKRGRFVSVLPPPFSIWKTDLSRRQVGLINGEKTMGHPYGPAPAIASVARHHAHSDEPPLLLSPVEPVTRLSRLVLSETASSRASSRTPSRLRTGRQPHGWDVRCTRSSPHPKLSRLRRISISGSLSSAPPLHLIHKVLNPFVRYKKKRKERCRRVANSWECIPVGNDGHQASALYYLYATRREIKTRGTMGVTSRT